MSLSFLINNTAPASEAELRSRILTTRPSVLSTVEHSRLQALLALEEEVTAADEALLGLLAGGGRSHSTQQQKVGRTGEMAQQVTNSTNAVLLLHQLKHGWNSPKATVIRIEALVLIAAFLSFFLFIFGSWRCWCKHWFIQKGVLAAYVLSFSLVTYTMGSMQSSAIRNEMFPVWALSLFPVLGCTNTITAYSLDDNKQYMAHFIQQLLITGYALLIIGTITNNLAAVAALLLFFETQQKIGSRIVACMLPCQFFEPVKQIADYMESEHKIETQYDPVSMKGYAYLVQWNFRHMKLNASTGYKRKLNGREGSITIEKIWQCNHGLLGSASSELKDVCLSFALYQLLKRRFYGFHCAEAGQMKTKDFVFEGLLSERGNGYERAFKIIEVELSLLYDFFYTKYASIYLLGFRALTWSIVTTFCLCFIGIVTVLQKIRIDNGSDDITVVNTNTTDIAITLIVLASLALLELIQAILYWTSNWGKVALVCDYIHQPSLKRSAKFSRRVKEFLSRFSLLDRYYWQRKIGQYSLLDSYVYNSSRNFSGKVRSLPYGHSTGNNGLCTQINKSWYGLKRRSRKRVTTRSPLIGLLDGKGIKGRIEGESIRLTVQVKTAVIDTLKRTNGYLTKGTSSLHSNKVYSNISRAFQFQHDDTETHTILIWHIATCYCEMAPSSSCTNEDTEEGKFLKDQRDVATQLSKYCAYLVVSAPELLSDNQWNTSELFNAVVKETRRVLKGTDNTYQMMKSLEEPTETIFQRGARLGRQLESISNVPLRWKVMADFWAEMILYVALSDNVREHIEHLAKGGEFITHLWALLFHAGIVRHGEEDQNV